MEAISVDFTQVLKFLREIEYDWTVYMLYSLPMSLGTKVVYAPGQDPHDVILLRVFEGLANHTLLELPP